MPGVRGRRGVVRRRLAERLTRTPSRAARPMNPYLLDTPAVVSFSGGRTSGYMLWHVLQAFGGTLPDDVKVVFCNTGKERPETLDFVERCGQRWGVPVVWLEYRHTKGVGPYAVEVTYDTASRDGEPLEAAITSRRGESGFLPNPLVRYCTIECKILTAVRWIDATLGWPGWTNAVGFRADEPARLAKLNGPIRESREDGYAPLARAGVTKRAVLEWWGRHPFDLELEPHESNCDLCFLKGKGLLLDILNRRPDLADWWVRMETMGGRFRNDRPGYSKLLELSQRPRLFDSHEPDELSIACHCTD